MEINIERDDRWMYGITDEGYDSDIDNGIYNCSVMIVAVQSFSIETKNCTIIKTDDHLIVQLDNISYTGEGEYGHYILSDVNLKVKTTLHECYLDNNIYLEGSWYNVSDPDSNGLWRIKLLNKK